MRRTVAVLMLLILGSGFILPGGLGRQALANQDTGDLASHPIVGSWRETAYEEGIPPLELLTQFGSDGTITSAGIPVFVAPDMFNYVGGGIGVWEPVDATTAAYTVEHMLADADGFPAGRQMITGTRTVSDDGQAFTGQYTFMILAPDGTVIYTSQGTDEGTRMTVEAAPAASPQATPVS